MNSFLAYTDKQSYYPNEIINIYSHYPETTSYTDISTSINFQSVFNSWTTNQKTTIIKQNNLLKVILNQTNSTPGILLSKIKVLSNIIRINYEIDKSNSKLNVNPLIRDLSNNVYYWLNKINNVIEVTNKYIILKLPDNLINNFINIFLLASGIYKLYDSFTLNNFSISFLLQSQMEIRLFNDQKKLIDDKVLYSNNIINQKFKPYSFAYGCDWINNQNIDLSKYNNLKSAYYFISLTYKSNIFYIPIIIKSLNNSKNKILVLANTSKWNAYNDWGGLDGFMSLYTWKPSSTFTSNSFLQGTNGIGTINNPPKPVSNFVSYERPNLYSNKYINTYMNKNIRTYLNFNDHIYGEMFLLNYLADLNLDFDVITDFDMNTLSYNDISNYKIFMMHVHPEYWSINQINLLDEMNKNNINIMYLGGNGIYWKYTIINSQMEVRKDRKFHLDGSKGGQIKELKLKIYGEDIVKIYYKKMYSTSVQFNFPYIITNSSHGLFDNLDISNNQFGFNNLNSKSLQSGAAGWEVDCVQKSENSKYIIAKSNDNFCNMIWKDNDDGKSSPSGLQPSASGRSKVFSTGSITYTGSLFVDDNIYKLTTNVINNMLN